MTNARPPARSLLPFLLVPALAGSASAQTKDVVLETGTVLLLNATVEEILNFAVTDTGEQFAFVRVENWHVNWSVLRNGVRRSSSSAPLQIDVNAAGERAWKSPSGAGSSSVGAVFSGGLVRASGVPNGSFGPGTLYTSFGAVKINASDALLVVGEIDDPAIPGSQDALYLLRRSFTGYMPEEEFLVVEGFPVGTRGLMVQGVETKPTQIALNDRDGWMAVVRVELDPQRDSTIMADFGDGAKLRVLAREGDPFPAIPGRSYADLGAASVDMNALSDVVHTVFLDGAKADDVLLAKNGSVVVREGDVLDALAPHAVSSFGTAPVRIADSGDVFWYARTSGEAGSNQAYMRNHQVVIREGGLVDRASGITGLRGTEDAFAISQNGRFWLGWVELGDKDVLVLADYGAIVPMRACQPNPASLTHTRGDARLGETVTFEMDGAQGVDALPLLLLSDTTVVSGSPCGIQSEHGEILIGLESAMMRCFVARPYAGTPSQFELEIPVDRSLVGRKAYVQGVFLLPSQGEEPRVHLSNGYSIEVGA